MADNTENASTAKKPAVLILGGSGFIGRNLVEFLLKNDLSSKIRVVDKVPPSMAWLNKNHQDAFSDARVEFKSANLINLSSCQNAFTSDDIEFDYVINLASETKMGQSDPVYKEGILKLSINCAKEAAKRKVKRYIEVSCGQMYSSAKVPHRECDKLDPWTNIARFKLMVEEELKRIPNLDYVVIRPAIVYGIGDKHGLTPRLVVGSVYKHLGEMMKLLWNKDLKMNTVHVWDVCRAIWHLFRSGKTGETYNVVDKGDSTQGMISELISDIFNINHDYLGMALSTLAKVDMQSMAEEINDKHLTPWAEACNGDNIINTPLNPYLDQEYLYHKHLHLDGTKLEDIGFRYSVPQVTKELFQQILQDYARMGIFPQSLLL